MACDKNQLKEILLEVLSDETGIAGVPIVVVEQRMREKIMAAGLRCGLSQIRKIIQRALDDWEIDKTTDELDYSKMRELGLPVQSGFTWHLKILSPEKSALYKSLKPEVKALIHLLREQNDPENLGIMPKDDAIKRLTEQGFSEDDTKRIYAKDIIEDFWISWGDDSSVWCYGLVREYEKTEEYKQWREEMEDQAAEKEMRRYRFTEECETTDPIYGRLDQLADRQGEDLDSLEMKRETMDEDEYLRKKKEIETRDTDEESQWKQIIEMIYELPFDILIDLRNLLWKELPTPEFVLEFLEKKSKEKKSA
jgi:hypothetical protein